MTNDCVIRRMRHEDLPEVYAIENASFPTPWPPGSYEHELNANPAARYLVAEKDGHVIGFAGGWIIIDESHITNIAVAQAQRGHGYGRRLTEALLQYLSNLGADYTTLEVRESNEVAIGLYRSLGFVKVGVRKRYYSDTNEDGFIMVCDRLPEPEEDFEEAETVHLPEDADTIGD